MELRSAIAKFSKARILILGDLILDRFIRGETTKISPEAPVPVVEVKKEIYCLGGAGNVANNIVSLGGSADICSVVGKDYIAEILFSELKKAGITASGIVVDSCRGTSIKTRIIAGHQQVVRYDKETVKEVSGQITRNILSYYKSKIKDVDAVLISDYGKGVVTRKIIQGVINIARKYGTIVTVDPKPEHFSRYKKVDCITPNLNEAKSAMRLISAAGEDEVDKLGKKILKTLSCRSVLITRGESGMSLFESNKSTHIPTAAREVYDVSGAGDTVIAAFTLALACGCVPVDAARISNLAAGIVVGKLGTATVSAAELLEVLDR
ncbi:MAG: Bifunctional protein HldE [Elusimicrobia bacterium ADurb.Bin231]|nr:MAG: Bifunctional protein HldE [Elusimicrobia bacterium ADurb.Bin231]